MDQRFKVVPNSLNYADLKPESIQTDIRLTKFLPTATVNDADITSVFRFLLSGTGFLDPFSTYLDFTINVPDNLFNTDEVIKFVDRSAHSFINQITIKAQGNIIENIEHYDVLAAMLNDMIYSCE